MADELGFSLGKLNYCLKALKSKGLIKIKNFKRNPKKTKLYLCLNSQGYRRKNKTYFKFYEKKNERV